MSSTYGGDVRRVGLRRDTTPVPAGSGSRRIMPIGSDQIRPSRRRGTPRCSVYRHRRLGAGATARIYVHGDDLAEGPTCRAPARDAAWTSVRRQKRRAAGARDGMPALERPPSRRDVEPNRLSCPRAGDVSQPTSAVRHRPVDGRRGRVEPPAPAGEAATELGTNDRRRRMLAAEPPTATEPALVSIAAAASDQLARCQAVSQHSTRDTDRADVPEPPFAATRRWRQPFPSLAADRPAR